MRQVNLDLGVPVLGVGEGAGLHDVAVTLSSSVLTLELVATINLRGLAGRTGPSDFYRIRIRSYLSEPIRVEVHRDIRAKSLVHRAQLLGDKPGAVRTETLVVDIQAELGGAERSQTEENHGAQHCQIVTWRSGIYLAHRLTVLSAT